METAVLGPATGELRTEIAAVKRDIARLLAARQAKDGTNPQLSASHRNAKMQRDGNAPESQVTSNFSDKDLSHDESTCGSEDDRQRPGSPTTSATKAASTSTT